MRLRYAAGRDPATDVFDLVSRVWSATIDDVFQGEVSDDDRLIYVDSVLKGKLLERKPLVRQATDNTKEQCSSSPTLRQGIVYAISDAFDAHATMRKQGPNSQEARQAGVAPVVVLTKADLADAADYAAHARGIAPGVPVEALDAREPSAARRLADWLGRGRTGALLGSSGVGKSTLLNAMTGRAEATQAIREDDAKGRHTTTARHLIPAPGGAWLIDTPGMRALRLADSAHGLGTVFADIARLATRCRFADCAHRTEPGCAVQAAIAEGALDAARLGRWQKLAREEAYNAASLAEARARDRSRQKLYNQGKSRRQSKERP